MNRGRREEQRAKARKSNKSQAPKGVNPGLAPEPHDRQPRALGPDAGPPASVVQPQGDGEPLAMIADLRRQIAECSATMLPRHVLVARALAAGSSQKQAAIDAGYAASNAASQGCALADDKNVKRLVELLLQYDIYVDAHMTKASLKHVLAEVAWGRDVAPSDRVAAVRVAARMEGYDRVKVDVTTDVPVIDGDALRKDLADRLARQIGKKEANE